jgi:hypothetical protein
MAEYPVPSIRTVAVTRYVTPLREGGSLPAIVEADDDGLYVVKFRGAGHGVHALIAEVVSGEIGRALGLPVPEIVLARLDGDLARTEPDPEIHALIYDSAGVNVGLDFLPGCVNYDPTVHAIAPDLASRIVWFDALVTNVDRTARNTNMLIWHRAPWLIDHGSTLYFHHTPGWGEDPARPRAPFPAIRDHVLLRRATSIEEEDARLAAVLTPDTVAGILSIVPDEWLSSAADGRAADAVRRDYLAYFMARLAAPRSFVREAIDAR